MTAVAACHACGTELLENARFCHGCGSPVAQPAAHAEYKQVSVLFADVVHSMDIAAAVGAERLREIMAELVDRCTDVVQHYRGTLDNFTGDGIMAVFGAPVAMEDHAVRACLAALGVQEEIKGLAGEVRQRDGVDLQLRVGLNSGQVIAGEIGSGPFRYTAIGEQVGMAQRMESVAPPGGVMLSESTARLVQHATELGDPEEVRFKGSDGPVLARRLLRMTDGHRRTGLPQGALVGRDLEVTTAAGLLDRSMSGRGCVVCVAGPPGIGKTRLADEVVAMASRRGVEVSSVYCESHTSDVPFLVAAGLLREAARITELDDEAARAQVRAGLPDASDEDVLLLYDLMGIRDPETPPPTIHPDARRRRLTALINSLSLNRTQPVLYVIEDAHWIDEVSDSMLAEFLTVIPQTPSMVLITYRPDYHGALARVPGTQTISLAPLSDSETAALLDELLGSDPSVSGIKALVAERAGGNPFYAQEMIHELAERGVLEGERGEFTCSTDVADVTVPASLQATIAARIDRLDPDAKQTLNAAAVIGSRFTPELLAAVGNAPALDALLSAALIDQVRFTPGAEFAFRHPLIRAVAYESQLKSDRAEMHGRLAAAIEAREPESADQNAALIAEHLEAAGDLRGAYGWHMRAAKWATYRDIAAARLSWESATTIADALTADDPDLAAMCIAPRTMLCGIAWRLHVNNVGDRFDELRKLCSAAGDKPSLAIAMAGLVVDHAFQDRVGEASRLASEAIALIESIGDPTLTVGLSFTPIRAKMASGEWSEMLRLSQRVIDLADGDPAKGNFLFGSPLALAYAQRATARYALGLAGWRDDQRRGLAVAHGADSLSYVTVVSYVYTAAVPAGALRPDDSVVREIQDALAIAERSGDNLQVGVAWLTLGLALLHRDTDADRDRGQRLLLGVRDVFVRGGHFLCDLPMIDVYVARQAARRGEHDEAIPLMSAAVDHLARGGQLLSWGILATGVLVETLLDRGSDRDVADAEAAIERLAAAPADEGLAIREIWLYRMRALMARARGESDAYACFRDRYRDMARTLGFVGHADWAEAMR
ncbi:MULTISPECIES: adenylate/guanylate cyclase domain-containing protein [unclassified Mycobacterium]|uniref:AAA family ATPase n=1 Tax=unclassified Mycobacterium TaxID=2642494 RepID=UPI0007FC0BE0|nr:MULTISPECIES: adenylate/guanylate cyclase domain-containing protein [unclassified Mycobacterium]OBG55281.1 cyclase [Mycobacterium sp. E735]OBG73919.1 cyclase [Mycobacterium sp. E3305]OBG94795.1 cyclase [Mycobacterium sp. E3298]